MSARTEFNIEAGRVRQETLQKLAALRGGQIIVAAFRGMPRRDDERARQACDASFGRAREWEKGVQPDFEKLRQAPQPGGALQIGARRDHGDEPRNVAVSFDRSALYHIFMVRQLLDEGEPAPSSCSRANKN